MILISIALITTVILIKYKPIYKVSVSGEELGYIDTKEALEESIKNEIIENQNKNIDSIEIKEKPEYELKLVDRTIDTSQEEISSKLQEDIIVTYKYYEIALNNDVVEKVNTLEEAEELVEVLKSKNNELDLNISEKYTQNEEEIITTNIELAKQNIYAKANEVIEQQKSRQEEEDKINSIQEINGIKIAVKPVAGTITSRYGVSSRIRSSNHTGLDIAAKLGTPIQAVADGTVINASYSGAYGNLIKVDHGNNVETWYAHTSKMYVEVGEKVKVGEVIAAVGSTGNSTGAHLHLEIRINGQHVNPQNYLYK